MPIIESATDKEKVNLILSKFDIHSYEWKLVNKFLYKLTSDEYFTLEQYEEGKDDAVKDAVEEERKEFDMERDELKEQIADLESDKEELEKENEELKEALKKRDKRQG